jgi:hypothetical protein
MQVNARLDWREIIYLQSGRADGTAFEERAAMRDVFWTATRLIRHLKSFLFTLLFYHSPVEESESAD